MCRVSILLLLLYGLSSAATPYPQWFQNAYKAKQLSTRYNLVSLIKPAFLQADFNGDGAKDIAVQIVEKNSKKKGILVVHQKSLNYYVFGAGVKFGEPGIETFTDVKWVDGWEIFKDRVVYETKFDDEGDIVGSTPKKVKFDCISIWQSQDGSPLAGGVIYWDGKKYEWIHQGE